MSALRGIVILGLAAFISTAAYSAHFVGEQIAFLHQKLSRPASDTILVPDWPNSGTALPKLEDQLAGRLQPTSPVTLTDVATETVMSHSSR